MRYGEYFSLEKASYGWKKSDNLSHNFCLHSRTQEPCSMNWQDIWKKGIPLSDAPSQFSPSNLRKPKVGQEPPSRELSKGDRMMVAAWDETGKHESIDPALKFFGSLGDLSQQLQRSMEIRTHILQMLRNEKLIAYGYSVPRHPDDIPKRINPDLIDAESPRWKNESIKGSGLEYVSVRVFSPKLAKTLDDVLSGDEHKKPRRPGRPSTQKYIMAVIEELTENGVLSEFQYDERKAEAIQNRVKEKYPEKYGKKPPSIKTIKKYLSIYRQQSESGEVSD
jgi:hypothetical protein